MSVPRGERTTTRPSAYLARRARYPSDFGSRAEPTGDTGLSTAAANIGSGSIHTMINSFHANVPRPGATR
jgi:hypothetical protein